MASKAPVHVGDKAPDFELTATNGQVVRLSDFRDRCPVVLFFYPKDSSPACTAQACSFRDRFDSLRELGAEVIGISSDSIASHRRFAERNQLPFLLLSDAGGALRALYGVPRTLGVIPGRVTYVIDRQGIVRLVFSSQLMATKHVDEALSVLRALRADGEG